MKKTYAWILAPVIAATVAWLLLGDNEEQKVLDRLEQIRSLAEVRDQENPLTRLGRAKQLGTLFSAQTRYDLTTVCWRQTYRSMEIAPRSTLRVRPWAPRTAVRVSSWTSTGSRSNWSRQTVTGW